MEEFWGFHLLLDCEAGDKKKVADYETIHSFIKALVPAINMVAYREPQIVHFAEHDPDKAGFSMVQLIETSSITGHFVDSTGDFYLDVFSCKDFDKNIVLNLVRKYFEPKNIYSDFVYRDAKK